MYLKMLLVCQSECACVCIVILCALHTVFGWVGLLSSEKPSKTSFAQSLLAADDSHIFV